MAKPRTPIYPEFEKGYPRTPGLAKAAENLIKSYVETGPRDNSGGNPWPDNLGRDTGVRLLGRAPDTMDGPQFRESLRRIGMSQRDFAEWIGVDERSVGRWANDRQAIPKWVRVIIGLRMSLGAKSALHDPSGPGK